MPCLETISMVALLNDVNLHVVFLSDHFKGLDAFYKSSCFLNYSTLMYGGDRMQ